MENAVSDLIAAMGVLLASSLLGVLKGYTSRLDGKLGNVVKPVQPLLVAVAGIALPMASAALEIAPVDPSVFITAPTATILAVSAREVARRVQSVTAERPRA